jgi:hypothetical protein
MTIRASTTHALPPEVDDDVRHNRDEFLELHEVRCHEAGRRLHHRSEDARVFHHAPGEHLIERRKRHREVLETLGTNPARAEHDHGPELWVLLHAEDELEVNIAHHVLDRDALDHRVRRVLLYPRHNLLVGVLEVR